LKALVQKLVTQGVLLEDGSPGQLRLSSHKPALNEEDRQLLDELRATFATAALTPPSVEKVASDLEADAKHTNKLLDLLCDEGELVHIGSHFFYRPSVDTARKELIENARTHDGEVSIPKLRDVLVTSRRFMIPILEYFDGTGITVRRGDKRFLRASQLEGE
jgi:selenocysteine-specific elongation factor